MYLAVEQNVRGLIGSHITMNKDLTESDNWAIQYARQMINDGWETCIHQDIWTLYDSNTNQVQMTFDLSKVSTALKNALLEM